MDGILVHHLSPHSEEHRPLSRVYHRELSNRCLDEARAIADEVAMELDLPGNFDTGGERENPGSRPAKTPLAPCFLPWESVSINEKGEVMACCASQKILGKLTVESFEDVWNGKQYRLLRETVNSDNPMGDCRHCVVRGGNVEGNILKAIGGGGNRSMMPRLKHGIKSLFLKAGQDKLLNRVIEIRRRLSS